MTSFENSANPNLDVHFFHTHNENREKGLAEIVLCSASS